MQMSELTKEFVIVDDIRSVMKSAPEDASADGRDEPLLTTDIIMEDYDQHPGLKIFKFN